MGKYAGHTPGPWSVRPVFVAEDTLFRKAGDPTGEWEIVYEDNQKELGEDPWFIADIHDGMPGSAEANARLIADAPSLLKALEDSRARFVGLATLIKAVTGHDSIMAEEAIERIDAALNSDAPLSNPDQGGQ